MFNVFNKIFDADERNKETQSVTLQEINSFAKRIANENVYNVVAVGKNIKLDEIKLY